MNVLSLCSGGGLGDHGLKAAGMTVVAACEIDAHARAVLRRHNPDARIYHDIAEVTRGRLDADGIGPIDLVAGGTPCQDLSVAGSRAGLAGERSGLFHEFLRVADEIAPSWVLWENVDGALSCTGGEDFAEVLGGLSGYRPVVPADGWRSGGVCQGPKRAVVWRVLDARGFGVPHRRRRVFVLGGVGALAARAVTVLFEPEASGRDSATRRKEGPDVAASAGGRSDAFGIGGELSDAPASLAKVRGDLETEALVVTALDTGQGGVDDNDAQGGRLVVQRPCEVVESDYAPALSAGGGKPGQGYAAVVQPMRGVQAFDPTVGVGADPAKTPSLTLSTDAALRTNGAASAVLFHATQDPVHSGSFSPAMSGRDAIGVHHDEIVRRLTPLERDRLMGVPDDYTRWGVYDDGEVREVAMTNRDRITGNGIVATVTEWIGRRIIAEHERGEP